jgi:glycosyltransferase involved in cell wall biosynthesis
MKKVDILLATYKPNIDYFIKLLISLNNQTYSNINIVVRDDSVFKDQYKLVVELLQTYVTKIKYTVYKNDYNIGSNLTFEHLTKDSTGDYIAYCDQDDIWDYQKIEKLVQNIEIENNVLSYSDLSIIDKNDKLLANSFKDIHYRLNHLKGSQLFKYFLRRNCVTGCTMLIKSSVARNAIPFSKYYVHDHWLALFASSVGQIGYIPEPLVLYRLHGDNQIGAKMLVEVNNKNDYYDKKLLYEKKRLLDLLKNNRFDDKYDSVILNVLEWTEERIEFFENKTFLNLLRMIKKIPKDYQLILFEILLNYLNIRQSEYLLKFIKK